MMGEASGQVNIHIIESYPKLVLIFLLLPCFVYGAHTGFHLMQSDA